MLEQKQTNSVKAHGATMPLKYFMTAIPFFVAGTIWGSLLTKHNDSVNIQSRSLEQSHTTSYDDVTQSGAPMAKQESTTQNSSSSSTKTKPGFCRTSSTGYEIILESLLGIIFREGDLLLEQGDVLDVGAQFGEQACHLATLAPDRQVFAMDPSPSQAESIRTKFASKLPNLNVINAGIGSNLGTGKAGEGFTGMKPGEEFRIETIDHVFFEQGRKLAFAHIDVEGRELDVLHGGTRSINGSKPIFTVEVRVHQDPVYTKNLLQYIDKLGYDTYVVNEVCGWPHMDYRNILCVPRKLGEKLVHSDAFNLAAATEAVFRVDSASIFEKVYPECKLGGELCPGDNIKDKGCCGEKRVKKWHQINRNEKPVAMQGFTYSKRATKKFWNEVEKRSRIS